MTKKQMEKKFDCTIHMDYIEGFRFYTAFSNGNNKELHFLSASGYTLKELQESIEENIQ